MNLLQNYINGAWVNSGGTESINVVNPDGLEIFTFLEDWTTGIEFIKEEEEDL